MQTITNKFYLLGMFVLSLITFVSCNDEDSIEPPLANFTAQVSATNTLMVATTNTSENADSYVWDFGDGAGASTEENPTYTYTEGGSYSIKLIATNEGGSTEAEQTVVVTAPVEAPTTAFTATVSDENKLVVTTTNTSVGADSYSWNFGDGTGTSTEENPSYTYVAGGEYTITLTATNSGGSNEATQTVTVIAPPTAAFIATVDSFNTLKITTDNTSEGATSFIWDFGDDAGTSTDENPSYTYAADGTYTIELIAVNEGGTDTTTQMVTVITPLVIPVAEFSVNVDFTNSLMITTTNTSIDADSYLWDFGDGTGTSTDENPSYTYATAGTFTITLTATNDDGSDMATQDVTVDFPNLIANGDMSNTSAWTEIAIFTNSDNTTNHRIESGVYKFENDTDVIFSNVLVWQTIDVEVGVEYQLSADVESAGTTNAWFEIYFGNEPVTETNKDYNSQGIQVFLKSFGTGEDCAVTAFDADIMNVAADGCPLPATSLLEHGW